MANLTPRPWTLGSAPVNQKLGESVVFLADANGVKLQDRAGGRYGSADDMAHAVACVNTHEAMLGVLRQLHASLFDLMHIRPHYSIAYAQAEKLAEEALASAAHFLEA